MEQDFHWIQRIQGIQRIWEITEAWMWFSIRIYFITCVSVRQWYHLCLLHRRSWVPILQSSFLFCFFFSLNSENSVKTFRENSVVVNEKCLTDTKVRTVPCSLLPFPCVLSIVYFVDDTGILGGTERHGRSVRWRGHGHVPSSQSRRRSVPRYLPSHRMCRRCTLCETRCAEGKTQFFSFFSQ